MGSKPFVGMVFQVPVFILLQVSVFSFKFYLKLTELITNRKKEGGRYDAEGKKAQLLYNLQFKLWISNRNTEIRGTFK